MVDLKLLTTYESEKINKLIYMYINRYTLLYTACTLFNWDQYI